MGTFKEARFCSHCETYKTRDRTSLMRHQNICSQRQKSTAATSNTIYPSPSQSVSSSDAETSNSTGVHTSPAQPLLKAFTSKPPPKMPAFRYPQAAFGSSTPSFPLMNLNPKRNTSLVSSPRTARSTDKDYELKALRSRVDELERELAMFSVMQSQWRTLEAKVRNLESWICE